jgi:hypothetical protein
MLAPQKFWAPSTIPSVVMPVNGVDQELDLLDSGMRLFPSTPHLTNKL